MREQLLIGIDEEKFSRREVDPDAFEAALKKATEGSLLEEIYVCLGDDTPLGKNAYHYLVTTEKARLRPNLLGIPGVERVLVFSTKPMPDPI